MKEYRDILKKAERLQQELMEIIVYSEEVYQGLDTTIRELEDIIEGDE